LYEQVRNAGLVCRRCGISRPTLRKWLARYQAQGVTGLLNHSRRPHRSPRQKAGPEETALILDLRRSRRLGIKRLRNELIRLHQIRLSLATLHKLLRRHSESRLAERRWRRVSRSATTVLSLVTEYRWTFVRSRPACTTTSRSTIARDTACSASSRAAGVLHDSGPAGLGLARSARALATRVQGDRPHSSLGGKTPIDRVCELSNQTPLREEVDALYSEETEPVRHPEYAVDIALRKLKRSL
jgi:transposase